MSVGEVLLTASRLDKSFGPRQLCQQVSLGLVAGERLGIIGDNGAGKSTLLRMLAGLEAPDGGQVVRRGGLEVAFVPQVPCFDEARVGEVWEGALAALRAAQAACERAAARGADTQAALAEVERLGGWDVQHRIDRAAAEVGLAGVDPATPVATLSGGQAKRLALGRMILGAPDLVLLDEPTNHLDTEAIVWLEGWLVRRCQSAIVVTHDRAFLEAVVERMAELRGGRLRLYDGAYAEYVAARAELEAQEARADARRSQILRAEVAWACRSPQARGTRQQARLKRLAALRAQVPAPPPPAVAVAMPGAAGGPPPGRVLLELGGVQAEAAAGAPLFAPFSLAVRAQERWGIVGANGVGKTTLLRLIQGTQKAVAGSVRLAPRTKVASFDQHRAALDPGLRVAEALSPTGADQVFFQGQAEHVSSYLRRFGFAAGAHAQSVARLSGGEASRLALAKFLLTDAWVLLLDEPTNDLDLLTLSILEDALVNFRGALLVVSHDRYFLDKVATGIVLFVAAPAAAAGPPHRLLAEPGGLDRVMAVAAAEAAAVSPSPPRRRAPVAAAPSPRQAPAPSARPLTFTERHRMASLEGEVAAAEAEVAALQAALADPALWSADDGPTRGRGLAASLADAEAALGRLMDAWAALAGRDPSA